MRKCLVSLMLALGLLTTVSAPAVAAERPKLVVMCFGGAYQNFFETELIPEFSKANDVDIVLAIGLAKDWMAEMRASGKDKAPYDVLMFNEIWSAQMRREGYMLPLTPAMIPNLDNAMMQVKDPTNGDVLGVIGVIQPAGLGYRTDLLPNPPKSWKDLWNPEYKGQVGLYTLTNSLGAMTVLSVGKVWFGDEHKYDEAIDKIAELKPFKQTDFSGDMEKLLSLGEISVGVIDMPAVARLRQQGLPLGWVEPEEHMVMFEQVFSIHKASKYPDLAAKWIDYILTPEVQEKFTKRFVTTPAIKGGTVPDELKTEVLGPEAVSRIASWDWNAFNDAKARLIRVWNQKINR